MIVFTDSASLMWRLSLAGKTGLEPYWQEVAAFGDRFFPQAGPHFAHVHYALVPAATRSGGLAPDWRKWKPVPPTPSSPRVPPPSSLLHAFSRSPAPPTQTT